MLIRVVYKVVQEVEKVVKAELTATPDALEPPDAPVPPDALWRRTVNCLRPTFRYWMETEIHVYAFSIAANVILSFYPFLLVISYLCYRIFGYTVALNTMRFVLGDFFGDDFIVRNLPIAVRAPTLSIVSLFLLLFTANGVFEPLEVALNRAWGITKNRSYVKNQLISLGMIFLCGSLALLSTVLAALNSRHFPDSWPWNWLEVAAYKSAAVPVTILILFLIYWLLPNAKISWKAVLPPAVVVGLAIEAFKFVNLVTFPLWLHKLEREYGPFRYSALIILWSFLGSLLLLAGAEWAARRAAEGKQPGPVRELRPPLA